MPADEFHLIQRYFADIGTVSDSCVLGIGDDAAVMRVEPGHQLVTCMDTLIESVHFPATTPPADIAFKSLAVNLSDLAAMGAEPDWFQLSLSIPGFDENWLRQFSQGLQEIAECYSVALVGGDTCRGALSITVQASGRVPDNAFVRRDQAKPGDLILVSGQLGDAALGLAHLTGKLELDQAFASHCEHRLNRPQPRVDLLPVLRRHASAAIDISDGLVGDLSHILRLSGSGAVIYKHQLPVSEWISRHDQYDYALYGGDDYEICMTVPGASQPDIEQWNRQHVDRQLTVIGQITDSGYFLEDGAIRTDLTEHGGFNHFA